MSKIITLTAAQLQGAQTLLDFESLRRLDAATPNPYKWLTLVEREVVSQDFQPADGLLAVPVEPDLGLWEEEVEYYHREKAGEALYLNTADTGGVGEVPLLSAKDTPERDKVYSAFVGYKMSFQELAAPTDRQRYTTREADADCKEALDCAADRTIIEGTSGKAKIRGFLDDKTVPREKLTDAGYTAITEGSSADDDIKTLNHMMNAVATDGKGSASLRPDTLALPQSTRDIIATKLRSNTDKTVLLSFVENSPYLRRPEDVLGLQSLEGAGPSGIQIAVAYKRDPRVVRIKMLPPRRFKMVELLFGQCMVWICRHTPVQWKKPLGGRKYTWATT